MNIFPTVKQTQVLRAIKKYPGQHARVIALKAKLTVGSIDSILKELREKALVRTEDSPEPVFPPGQIVSLYFITDWGNKVVNLALKAPYYASSSSAGKPGLRLPRPRPALRILP